MSEFRRSVDAILSNAEAAVSGRYDATKYGKTHAPAPALQVASLNSPSAAYGHDSYYAGGNGGGYHESGAAATMSELARQVRACMKEIFELRTELNTERDGRNQVTQSHIKRAKDELLVELHASQHGSERSVRELESVMMDKFRDLESQRAADKKKIDDATRSCQIQVRQQFDSAEHYRESLDEIRSRVDQAVTQCQVVRSENVAHLENHKQSLQNRLETELIRYADMNQRQQQTCNDLVASIKKEFADVTRHVRGCVDDAWNERFGALMKTVNAQIDNFKAVQEQQSHLVAQLQEKFVAAQKAMKGEIQTGVVELRERVVSAEGAIPILTTRVDRFERRSDAVMETSSKLSATVDTLREASDRSVATTQRCIERVQKAEDSMAERDTRIGQLESMCTALPMVDKLRTDTEVLRRGLARVENSMDGVKQTADRDERMVEQMHATIEGSLERADAIEKKATRMITRVETAEQRMVAFADRVVKLEESSERQASLSDRAEALQISLQQRHDSSENRIKIITEKVEFMGKDSADRLKTVEGKIDSFQESLSRIEVTAGLSKKDIERIDKRAAKMEANMGNALENVAEAKEVVEQCSKDTAQMRKRTEQWRDGMERQERGILAHQEEVDSLVANLQDRIAASDRKIATAVESAEKRTEGSIELLGRRLEDTVARVRKEMASGGGAAARPDADMSHGYAPTDPNLMFTVSTLRGQHDMLAMKVQAVEAEVAKATAAVDSLNKNGALTTQKAIRRCVQVVDALGKRVDALEKSPHVPSPKAGQGQVSPSDSFVVEEGTPRHHPSEFDADESSMTPPESKPAEVSPVKAVTAAPAPAPAPAPAAAPKPTTTTTTTTTMGLARSGSGRHNPYDTSASGSDVNAKASLPMMPAPAKKPARTSWDTSESDTSPDNIRRTGTLPAGSTTRPIPPALAPGATGSMSGSASEAEMRQREEIAAKLKQNNPFAKIVTPMVTPEKQPPKPSPGQDTPSPGAFGAKTDAQKIVSDFDEEEGDLPGLPVEPRASKTFVSGDSSTGLSGAPKPIAAPQEKAKVYRAHPSKEEVLAESTDEDSPPGKPASTFSKKEPSLKSHGKSSRRSQNTTDVSLSLSSTATKSKKTHSSEKRGGEDGEGEGEPLDDDALLSALDDMTRK